METDPLSVNLESVSERSYLKHYKYNIQQQRKIKKIISIKDLLPRKVNEYKHVEHVETY